MENFLNFKTQKVSMQNDKNYKYNININQFAIIQNNLQIDLIDAAIFDAIKDFAQSPKCQKMADDGVNYFWVKWDKIVSDMPLLGISTRQNVIKRLSKLKNANLIMPHENNQIMGQSWYSFGANYDKMISYDATLHPVTQTLHPCNPNVTPPVTQTLHNNSIKDNSINIITSSSSSTHEEILKNENSEIEKDFSDNLVEVLSEKKEKSCEKKEKEIRIKSASECLEEVRAYIAENKATLRLTLDAIKWNDGESGTLKEELQKLVIKYSENLEWNKNPTKGIFNILRNWLENKKQHSENQKLNKQKSNEYTNRNNSNGRNGHTYDRQESDNLIAHANRAIAGAKRAAEMGGFDC